MSSESATNDRPNVLFILTDILFGVLCISVATPAHSQNYPTKPIRLIVPYAPGGVTDTPWRIVAPKLSEVLGQQVVIDNRSGASSTIGAALAAKAPPDGYTLLGTSGTHVMSAGLFKNLPYDAINDFVAVVQIAVTAQVLVVHPSLPVRSVKELIALAKSKPGKIDYASSGSGGGQHLFFALFASMAGIEMNHIPYKSIAQSLPDVIAGRVPTGVAGVTVVMPHVEAGRLRALAVTSAKRSQFLPFVPTFQEAGVNGYEATQRVGMLGPKALPAEIVEKLDGEIRKIINVPDVQKSFLSSGNEASYGSSEQFGAVLKSEFARWTKLIKEIGAQVD